MNTFAQGFASASNMTVTTNGCGAYKTTKSAIVDFFFEAGSMCFDAHASARENLYSKFVDAFKEDPIIAIAALFWLRDIRGGAGQREMFKFIVERALDNKEMHPYIAKCLQFIPEYGRWDDLWKCGTLLHEDLKPLIAFLIMKGLADAETSKLVAKWLPRERKQRANDKVTAYEIMALLEKSPRAYRKMLSGLSKDLVEVKQSAKKWDEIVFEHVPSVAMLRYRNAFMRHCPERFEAYKEALKSGKTKINSATLYPFQIVDSCRSNDLADEQWKALPDYVPEGVSFIPLVDVSGSMGCSIGSGTTAMSVAISLGLYLSERQKGPFKNMFITFSSSPTAVKIPQNKSLKEKVRFMENADWGGNTDIHRAMKLILEIAKKNKVPAEDMPKSLIILSDMQFDEATRQYGREIPVTFLDSSRADFSKAGYEMPNVVFWNLAGNRYSNKPAECDTPGVSMVSGFSPSVMQYILEGKEINPLNQVLQVLTSKRYEPIIRTLMH